MQFNIMEECPKHGHDETFVSDTPEYLICTVCHLVFRNPLLVISCGHKYCQPCFDLLKQRSQDNNAPLLCPNDNQPIDEGRVCEDLGLRRTIGCLLVKCGSSVLGCAWEGELSELVVHQSKCQHRTQQQQRQQQQQLQQAVRQLEEKEKEINELKEKGRRNEEEIRGLQGLICELKGENKDLRMELGKVKAVSSLSEDDIPSVRGAISECGQAYAKDIETSAKEVDLRKPTQHSDGERFWFYGGTRDSVVMGRNNRLDFDKPCIIGVPAGMVCRGDKVYFEVTCSDVWDKCVWFALGLAKKNFQPLSNDVKLKGVLDIPSVKWWESNYYGFNA